MAHWLYNELDCSSSKVSVIETFFPHCFMFSTESCDMHQLGLWLWLCWYIKSGFKWNVHHETKGGQEVLGKTKWNIHDNWTNAIGWWRLWRVCKHHSKMTLSIYVHDLEVRLQAVLSSSSQPVTSLMKDLNLLKAPKGGRRWTGLHRVSSLFVSTLCIPNMQGQRGRPRDNLTFKWLTYSLRFVYTLVTMCLRK